MYGVECSAGFEIGHVVCVVWKYIHTTSMDGDAVRLAVSTRAAWRHPSNIHSSWAQAGPCWPSFVFIADYLTGVSGNTIDHNIDIMLYGPLVRHIMHHTYTGILVLCHGRSHDTHMTPTGGVAECCGHRPISAKRRDPKQINNELPQHRRPPPQHFCFLDDSIPPILGEFN